MFWKKTRDALIGVVEKSIQYDEDGIDLYFFNTPIIKKHLNSSESVREIFDAVKPFNGTPTAKVLKRVLYPYLLRLEAVHAAKVEKPDAKYEPVKPLNIVILTDGAPNTGEEPEAVIVVSPRLSTRSAQVLGVQAKCLSVDTAPYDRRQLDV